MRQRIVTLVLCALLVWQAVAQDKIRVSCVGNSVTYGMRLENREQTCYPAQLQEMLGEGYEVRNFGHSGATLMRNGHNPYHLLPEYREAIEFAGDIVIVHLGLNDTDPRNYAQRAEEFIPDYRQLIDSLRAANPTCEMYVCLMTPIFQGHSRFLSGTRDWHALIQDDIRRVALGAGAHLIDLYTPLHCRPETFPDNLHPNARGARILAETVYAAITGYRNVPLSLPAYYQDGMVLQRDATNVIDGRAPAHSAVRVRMVDANRRQAFRREVTTDEYGHWQVVMPAMTAGGPYTLEVTMHGSGVARQVLTLSDVYVGEVWLCSGQSNMEWINANLPADEQPAICRTGQSDRVDSRLHLLRMEGMRYIGTGQEWTVDELEAVNELQFIKPYHWQQPSRETVLNFSAIAYRVARRIAEEKRCHVGVICNAIGGSGIESWIDRTSTEWQMPEVLMTARPKDCDFLQDWVRRCIRDNTALATNPLQRHPFDPCYLYETSIVPLEGITLRGVMWYQGESNAHNLELYARQWHALTAQWRSVFRTVGDALLPFYTMQLAAISGRPSWPRFRNLQRQLADADTATHLVVTHDVGEQYNVHPTRKSVQAARLATSILHHSYGVGNTADSPQLVTQMAVDNTVVLSFSEALTPTGTLPEGWFEVAGADGIYYPAEAVAEGSVVRLSSQVSNPVWVRYAWRDFTDARLAGDVSTMMVSTFNVNLK